MDNYDRYEQDLNEKHDYDVCMATCPDWKSPKECGCGGSNDLPPMTVLAIFSPLIIIVTVIIVASLYKAIRNNKDKKEYEEYQRRIQLGDKKWVKEYEERRTQAFYGHTKKSKKVRSK